MNRTVEMVTRQKTEDLPAVDLQEIDSVRNMEKSRARARRALDPLAANQRQSGVLIH
jgi:hypothetical protein